MKKSKKLLLPLMIIIIAAAAFKCSHDSKITVYNPDGSELRIKSSQSDEYFANGYYAEPVQTVYAPNGKSAVIYQDEFADYSNVGWFSQEPVTIYTPTGRKTYIEPSMLDDYLSRGYFEEPLVTLYSSDGKEEISVKQSEISSYTDSGWSTERPEREGLEDLFAQIESYVLTCDGDWGVFVQDMQTNEYLTLNEKKYSGASLMKLFTMAAIYNAEDNGTLEITSAIQNQLEQMITVSSNSAYNYLTRTLGGGNTSNGFDVENEYTSSLGCSNTSHNSELVEYDGYKAYYKGNNRTSPRDCGHILTLIYKGKLVSQTASEKMLNLLKAQTRTWKIPSALPEGTVVANKTGETSKVEADAAIVYSPGGDYVLCVIGNGNVDSGTQTIQKISRITYDYFNN